MDGVALCRVLGTLSSNQVDVRTMKDFSPNPKNSQFLCCQNIRLFTHLCEKEFDISRSFLIQPNEIYQAKNFGKAITLLSKLSLSQRALKSGIAGFPSENSKLQTAHEYYNNLEEIAATINPLPDAGGANYTQMEEECNEKLYDTVVHQGTKEQSTAGTESLPARASCLREIVDTEKNYVELLKMLIERYKRPLTEVLSTEELDEMLRYIEQLYSIHRELLSNLGLATSPNMQYIKISDVFLQVRDTLLIYGEYCGHVQRAQSLVVELMRNDVEKRTRIEMCQANSEKFSKFQLTELLTVPIQRVLKYPLLLEQLCKLTPADHPDKERLVQAHEAMKELAQSINEVKRDLDTISAIDQIQASLLEISLPPDKKLSDYGRHHLDGELKVHNHVELKSKIRYLFLFDKTLFVCKPRGDSFTFMQAYLIVNGTCQETSNPNKKTDKYSFGFSMPIKGDRVTPSLAFFAKSAEVRQTWINAVKAAVTNQFPPGCKDNGYNFEMTTFKRPTYCKICGKLLLGIFYQGYRCRETGYTTHKACLANNSLPMLYNLPAVAAAAHLNGYSTSTAATAALAPGLLPPAAALSLSAASSVSTLRPRRMVTSGNPFAQSPLTCRASSFGNCDLFELSHLSDAMNSVNQWLAGGESAAAAVGVPPTVHRLRRISSNGGGGAVTGPVTALVRSTYYADPLPSAEGTPLYMAPGDVVELLQWGDDSVWWKGRCRGVEGFFPASIVEICPTLRQHRVTMGELSSHHPHHSNTHMPSRLSNHQFQPISTVSTSSEAGSAPSIVMTLRNNHRHSLPPASLDSSVGPRDRSDANKESWCSFEEAPGSEAVSRVVSDSSGTPVDAVSESVDDYDWYVGQMDRIEAVQRLCNCPNGTFLVRVSKSAERFGEYSLSIVYEYPRHIRIQRLQANESQPVTYGLCDPETFPSIPALIHHYSKVSLNRCFDEVDTMLLYPYQLCPASPLFYVRSSFDFSSDSPGLLLALKRDDRVAVLSRDAESRGWWKGWLNGRIGFFPMSYVVREDPVS